MKVMMLLQSGMSKKTSGNNYGSNVFFRHNITLFAQKFEFEFFLSIKSNKLIKNEPKGSKKYTGSIREGTKWKNI